ncbi:MAG: hypothetical protein K940chlam6_00413 [Chlamydiae bacterium]|nr:hypothetical protein [Chlamydiota bacterium]
MIIKFQNSGLRSSHFGETIQVKHQLIEDAIVIHKPDTAQRELTLLQETIANVSAIFPNATHDIRALENLQNKLLEDVANMSGPIGNVTHSAKTMKELPPARIHRNANNCGLNTIGQFLAGAPTIASMCSNRDPELKKLIQMIYSAQETGNTVSNNFGTTLRKKIGMLLKDKDLIEWAQDQSYSDNTQIDILIPLQHILEKAGFKYSFIQEREEKGKKSFLLDDNTGEKRLQTEFSVDLDLTNGSRDFQELLDAFFIQMPEEAHLDKKIYKFTEAPQDLVIAARRFGYVGEQHKISDSIQNVPEVFKLQPAYTQYGQDVNYELTGCAIHEGKGLVGGHYTYLRKSGNTWYHIDDATVTEVKDPRLLIEKGYIYHFQKTEAPVSSFSKMQNGGENELITDVIWTLQKTSQIAWWVFQTLFSYILDSNKSLEAKKDS